MQSVRDASNMDGFCSQTSSKLPHGFDHVKSHVSYSEKDILKWYSIRIEMLQTRNQYLCDSSTVNSIFEKCCTADMRCCENSNHEIKYHLMLTVWCFVENKIDELLVHQALQFCQLFIVNGMNI